MAEAIIAGEPGAQATPSTAPLARKLALVVLALALAVALLALARAPVEVARDAIPEGRSLQPLPSAQPAPTAVGRVAYFPAQFPPVAGGAEDEAPPSF